MRKIMYLFAALLINIFSLFAQNCEPDTMSFQFYRDDGTSYYSKMSENAVPQEHIVLSWQWGGLPFITTKLNMNSVQSWDNKCFVDNYYESTFIPPKRLNAIMASGGLPLSGQSMEYSAALKSVADSFVVIQDDPWRNIFGF